MFVREKIPLPYVRYQELLVLVTRKEEESPLIQSVEPPRENVLSGRPVGCFRCSHAVQKRRRGLGTRGRGRVKDRVTVRVNFRHRVRLLVDPHQTGLVYPVRSTQRRVVVSGGGREVHDDSSVKLLGVRES